MADIFLGVPTTRDFGVQYVSCLFGTRIHGAAEWSPLYGQAIDIARNALVKRFLLGTTDYLLMHDSDATWHPDAIERLASRNLPVVTGVIFKRGLPTVPTIGKYVGLGTNGAHLYSFAGTVNRILDVAAKNALDEETKNELLFDPQADDLEEIDGCGSHFMLIRRDVLEKIKGPWFESTTTNGGEDFDFCRKVQQAGFKMYVDYSVFTGHVVGPGLEIGIREFLLFRDKDQEVETPWEV